MQHDQSNNIGVDNGFDTRNNPHSYNACRKQYKVAGDTPVNQYSNSHTVLFNKGLTPGKTNFTNYNSILDKKYIDVLKNLCLLLELLDEPCLLEKEKFAKLSSLSVLSEIKGLELLKKLENLSKLKDK